MALPCTCMSARAACVPRPGLVQLAAALSAATGKTIEYVQLSYEAVEASFLEKGWPAWTVAGLLDLFRSINALSYGYDHSDFKAITGKEPVTPAQYTEAVKGGFL
jgi:hypothetical protein